MSSLSSYRVSEPFLSSFLLASPACVVNSELRGLGKKRDTTVRRRGCSQTPCDPCTGQPTACHSARRNHKRRCTLLPSRASGSLPSGVGLEIRTCSEVRSGGPRNEVQERSGGVWKFTHPHRMTPPGARSNPPYPPPTPPTPEFGRIRGGMGGYAQFAFSTRIRPFFNVSWNSSNSACFGCFFTQPRKHTFLHFFCQFQGVPGNPSKRRIPTPIPGGNPSAVYVFYSVLDTIRTA